MECHSYFTNIRAELMSEFEKAQKEICIAVAWFTNHDIFDLLIKKLEKKVEITLVVINDDVNNMLGGLDFQKFIDKGGKFFFADAKWSMHNKYCIIDDSVLMTGSYNYTNLAEAVNYENVVKFVGMSDIIKEYKDNFNLIISKTDSVQSIKQYLTKNPPKGNYSAFLIISRTMQSRED